MFILAVFLFFFTTSNGKLGGYSFPFLPGMWVLEGDEVVAVNGTNVEGKSLDEVGTDPMHKSIKNQIGPYQRTPW